MPSSSSSVPGSVLGVYLYDANKARVAYVGVQTPLPALLVYAGLYYVWSDVNLIYQVATPQTVSVTAQPPASVAANPIT